MNNFLITNKKINNFGKTFIIAEIAQAHDGSLGMAHAYIDAVAKTGVDAIKFQTHIASAESTLDEKFRVKFSRQDKTRYDYWKRMEFTLDQWRGLKEHADDCGIIFLSSAFSIEAVDLLNSIGMPAWKIGSGEFWSTNLIERMVGTGKPLMISTGMSNWKDMHTIVDDFDNKKHPIALMQCSTKYPTSYSDIGMNIFEDMQKKFDIPIGLSDHSGTIYPSLLALAKGAAVLEIHVTFHKSMFGPDVTSSVTLDELSQIVTARDSFRLIEHSPVDKDEYANELNETRSLFSKSLCLGRDLPINHIIQEADLCLRKPGDGIHYDKLNQVVGRKLIKKVDTKRLLKWDDFV